MQHMVSLVQLGVLRSVRAGGELHTTLFNVWWSLSLSFSFQPLFLSADDAFPWFVCAVTTLETAVLDAPNKVAILFTDATVKCASTIRPLWKSDKSPILLSYKLLLNTICHALTLTLHSIFFLSLNLWLVGSFPPGNVASHSFHCCTTASSCVSGDLL